jgi:aspartyl/asparaginyl beta-hydroxylase (cupin superfamily)
MFYRTETFDFVRTLESEFANIRDEFLRRFDERDARLWPQPFVYTKEWKMLPLLDRGRLAQHGVTGIDQDLERNQRNFPRTLEVLNRLPGLVTAGFSRLVPGTRIHPHKGIDHTVLRCHLGLVAPPGYMLHVNGMQRQWEDGCVWLFDDTYAHEVWSEGDEPRVVLIMDFNKNDLEKLAGQPLENLAIPRTPEEVERGRDLEGRCQEWQQKYAEAQPAPDWDKIFDYEADKT